MPLMYLEQGGRCPYLDSNEEAGGPVYIGHGRDGEHVPEGLAALAVVEDADGGLRPRLDGLPDDGHRLGVCVWALHAEDAAS